MIATDAFPINGKHRPQRRSSMSCVHNGGLSDDLREKYFTTPVETPVANKKPECGSGALERRKLRRRNSLANDNFNASTSTLGSTVSTTSMSSMSRYPDVDSFADDFLGHGSFSFSDSIDDFVAGNHEERPKSFTQVERSPLSHAEFSQTPKTLSSEGFGMFESEPCIMSDPLDLFPDCNKSPKTKPISALKKTPENLQLLSRLDAQDPHLTRKPRRSSMSCVSSLSSNSASRASTSDWHQQSLDQLPMVMAPKEQAKWKFPQMERRRSIGSMTWSEATQQLQRSHQAKSQEHSDTISNANSQEARRGRMPRRSSIACTTELSIIDSLKSRQDMNILNLNQEAIKRSPTPNTRKKFTRMERRRSIGTLTWNQVNEKLSGLDPSSPSHEKRLQKLGLSWNEPSAESSTLNLDANSSASFGDILEKDSRGKEHRIKFDMFQSEPCIASDPRDLCPQQDGPRMVPPLSSDSRRSSLVLLSQLDSHGSSRNIQSKQMSSPRRPRRVSISCISDVSTTSASRDTTQAWYRQTFGEVPMIFSPGVSETESKKFPRIARRRSVGTLTWDEVSEKLSNLEPSSPSHKNAMRKLGLQRNEPNIGGNACMLNVEERVFDDTVRQASKTFDMFQSEPCISSDPLNVLSMEDGPRMVEAIVTQERASCGSLELLEPLESDKPKRGRMPRRSSISCTSDFAVASFSQSNENWFHQTFDQLPVEITPKPEIARKFPRMERRRSVGTLSWSDVNQQLKRADETGNQKLLSSSDHLPLRNRLKSNRRKNRRPIERQRAAESLSWSRVKVSQSSDQDKDTCTRKRSSRRNASNTRNVARRSKSPRTSRKRSSEPGSRRRSNSRQQKRTQRGVPRWGSKTPVKKTDAGGRREGRESREVRTRSSSGTRQHHRRKRPESLSGSSHRDIDRNSGHSNSSSGTRQRTPSQSRRRAENKKQSSRRRLQQQNQTQLSSDCMFEWN